MMTTIVMIFGLAYETQEDAWKVAQAESFSLNKTEPLLREWTEVFFFFFFVFTQREAVLCFNSNSISFEEEKLWNK